MHDEGRKHSNNTRPASANPYRLNVIAKDVLVGNSPSGNGDTASSTSEIQATKQGAGAIRRRSTQNDQVLVRTATIVLT